MIHVTSAGGRIGAFCWANTAPADLIPVLGFPGLTTCLQCWGLWYWRPPGQAWSGFHYSVEETFQ